MSRLTILKNAFANLCRGGAAALVVLLLPPFLTRILDKDAYGTWLLILQLSTYVSFLDFGVQTAVGRFVAHCNELGDTKQRDSIISTSIAILSGAAVLAMVGISILAWQLPHLFKDMPASLHQDARLALLCVGGSLAESLPFSVFGAIFVGLQRYDVPAWIVGASKLLGGIFVVLVAQSSHSIVMMAVVMGIANLCTGLWQFVAYKKIAGYMVVSSRIVSKKAATEVMKYCSTLVIWSMGMILVTGLDTAIIGYFDYKSLAYYTLASSLTSFVIGIQNSIFTTILPNAAAIGARGDRAGLGKLLVSTTKYTIVILIVTSLPIIIGAKWILLLWVGENYAAQTTQLLQLLIIANSIRQIGAPFAIIAMAVGEQRVIILSPIIEGIVNVTASITLVSRIGVIGVAVGTIIGGVISVSLHFLYNLQRTKSILIEDIAVLYMAMFKPLIAALPGVLYLSFFTNEMINDFTLVDALLFCATAISTVGIIYLFVITNDEKIKFSSLLNQKLRKIL